MITDEIKAMRLSMTFGDFAAAFCFSWERFASSATACDLWPSGPLDPDAQVYALMWPDSDPDGRSAAIEGVRMFRTAMSVPDDAPCVVLEPRDFGPWVGKRGVVVGQMTITKAPCDGEALAFINRYRARYSQRALDPVSAGWTDDLRIEARRLGWTP